MHDGFKQHVENCLKDSCLEIFVLCSNCILEVDADDYYKTYCFRVMLDYLQFRRNIFSLAQMAVKVLAF